MTVECIHRNNPKGQKRLEKIFESQGRVDGQSCDISEIDGICDFSVINDEKDCPFSKLMKGEIDKEKFDESFNKYLTSPPSVTNT